MATVAGLAPPAQTLHLTTASKVALGVTGGSSGFFLILWIIYKYILLKYAKKKHVDETGYCLGLGQHGEGHIQVKESVERTGTKIGNAVTWVSDRP